MMSGWLRNPSLPYAVIGISMDMSPSTEPGATAPLRRERHWARSIQTRAALLEAAREVFSERGFTDAGIDAIVLRSGVSVGSLYHHFGGKAELFLALWEDFEDQNEAAARHAVAGARESGEADPVDLFVIGTEAYLEKTWRNRHEARLYLIGDAPAGFEALARRMTREWMLLELGDDPFARVKVMTLTSLVGNAASELCVLEDIGEVEAVINATLELIRKVAAA
jgi:AcrR family transcriptional regulator